MSGQDQETEAAELVTHCRYCGLPDYRPKCRVDHEESVAEVAAAFRKRDERIRELEKSLDNWKTCAFINDQAKGCLQEVLAEEREKWQAQLANIAEWAKANDDKLRAELAAAQAEIKRLNDLMP
jgi:hypothetical protein